MSETYLGKIQDSIKFLTLEERLKFKNNLSRNRIPFELPLAALCVLQPRDPIVTETFKKNRILVFCYQFILYAQKDFANVVGHF